MPFTRKYLMFRLLECVGAVPSSGDWRFAARELWWIRTHLQYFIDHHSPIVGNELQTAFRNLRVTLHIRGEKS